MTDLSATVVTLPLFQVNGFAVVDRNSLANFPEASRLRFIDESICVRHKSLIYRRLWVEYDGA